jgi:hypothetical protein
MILKNIQGGAFCAGKRIFSDDEFYGMKKRGWVDVI